MGIFRTNDPTQFDDIDGIIIDETAPPPSISGVAANIAILVAQYQRGPTADLSLPLASIGEFREIYGQSLFSGNKQLKNKRFGSLKTIRVDPTGSAIATLTLDTKLKFDALYSGLYGDKIKITAEDATSDVTLTAQIENVTCPADVSDSLDGEGILAQDSAGSVAFWIDTDDSGTTIPTWASAADRAVEVTTIVTDDTAILVAVAMAAAMAGDSEYGAPIPTTAIYTVTHTPAGARSAGVVDGDSGGFTASITTTGLDAVDAGTKYTVQDTNDDAILPVEIYDDIKIAEVDASTFANSALVAVTVVDAASGEVANSVAAPLAGGLDGTVVDTDYETAIAVAEQEKSGNVIFLDVYNSVRNAFLKTHVANTQDKMCIICGAEGDDRAAVITDVENSRDTDGRIIYAYPYVETLINGALEFTPPASWYASVFSQISPHIALSKTRNSGFLGGITALRFNETRAGFIALDAAGVSAMERDPDIGFIIKNAITTQIINSSKRTILRRRMADFLTDSIALFLKNYQNEVNSRDKRDEVKAQILDFDARLVLDGILPGASDVTSGSPLLVDTESLNTDSVIAAGFFKILYKRRIFSSMRYIVLQAEIGESVVVTEV